MISSILYAEGASDTNMASHENIEDSAKASTTDKTDPTIQKTKINERKASIVSSTDEEARQLNNAAEVEDTSVENTSAEKQIVDDLQDENKSDLKSRISDEIRDKREAQDTASPSRVEGSSEENVKNEQSKDASAGRAGSVLKRKQRLR